MSDPRDADMYFGFLYQPQPERVRLPRGGVAGSREEESQSLWLGLKMSFAHLCFEWFLQADGDTLSEPMEPLRGGA